MNYAKLIPNVYYLNIKDGIKLFVDCLGFTVGHQELQSENPFCVLEKQTLNIFLFQHEALAKEHNPEFRIVTDEIDAIYAKISASHPEYLHPNLSRVTLRPWGAKEFALRDHQVCIIFQQW